MALLTATNPTFLDLLKITDPAGNVLPVAEVLNETNEGVMEWMSWQEGNLPTGHMISVATSLVPKSSYGKLYKGVTPTKGTNAQVTESTMLLESMSEVDCRLIDMSTNPEMARWVQDRKHLETMRQTFFEVLFYGDPGNDPLEFRGFAPRFSSTSDNNGDNIILSGLTPSGTDNESIWLVAWGPETCFGIIPRNAPGGPGLQMLNEGKVTIETADDGAGGTTGRLKVYRTWFQMWAGLAIPDWRYVVRLANVDTSQVNADPASGGPNLIEKMKEMIERLPTETSNVRLAFYASRFLRQRIRQQYANSVKNSTLTMDAVGGLSPRASVSVDGIPVYRVDALAASNTGGEATIS